MSAKRFKFVSPGVFVNEIDNSQLPAEAPTIGPVIVGRTERGPSMRPVTVESQAEFIEMFGQPIPGGKSGDVWREGNYQSPTYASYAAMAYLRNNGPVTMVRLLGHEHPDKDAAGKAGWKVAHNAYGLFLYPSASGVAYDANKQVTGTLAAIFYCNEGAVGLKGGKHIDAVTEGATPLTTVSGTHVAVESAGSNNEFQAVITEQDGTGNTIAVTETINFNFDKNSDKFIRKVFNTNPALTTNNDTIAEPRKETYWLGQTFEDQIPDFLGSSPAEGATIGIMLQLDNGEAGEEVGIREYAASAGTTGWVISQQLSDDTASFNPKASPPTGVERLFKLSALDCGEWESANLKISIEDIRYSKNEADNPYGSFTVTVREAKDNDGALKPVERFANCNLNPQSTNYVKRKIGDQTLEWDEGERRYKVVGDYPNKSQFIRVEINSELDAAALDPQLLPFGFQGPEKPVQIQVDTTTVQPQTADFAEKSLVASNGANFIHEANRTWIGKEVYLSFPSVRTRTTTMSGSLSSKKAAYWGVDTVQSGSQRTYYAGWSDMVYPILTSDVADARREISWAVSLDDVKSANGVYEWAEGNRLADDSISSGGSWKTTLDEGVDKFTMPLHGGFDGLDVRALDPFAPNEQIGSDVSDKTSYEFYSVRKAIDTCSDPEVVECNMMAVPGITNNSINQHIINTCESRADALAVVDLDGGYLPRADRKATYTSFSSYGGSVTGTLSNLNEMQINSSYACSYYPWVQVRDQLSDAVLWVPPSVVAIGTMGSSEAQSEVWFAPAGFTRGGLSEGSAGMPVLAVRDRLTAKQRDDLYQQNVNPIASFPAEGIVIFGQKTMQVTPSALDRINVRRLMIFVKKEISRMAATTLFDQNVQRTWNRFLGRVNPFLRSVQARLGLTEFKVVLDETTTTPELIDRNIMYAKILLKPARAIEYIAVDFVITNSGASFED